MTSHAPLSGSEPAKPFASKLRAAIGISQGAPATMLGRTIFVLLSLACGLAWLFPFEKAEPESKISSLEL